MGCPHVRGDNPRAFTSGLSYVQKDKHGITILYNLHQCRPAHHQIFNAKVGKGGIKSLAQGHNRIYQREPKEKGKKLRLSANVIHFSTVLK